MKIHRLNHVGIIVNDLAAAKAFFVAFGLVVDGAGGLEGAWLDHVVGLPDVKTEFVFMRVPGGEASVELIKFHRPADENGIQPTRANTLGLRHIAFEVEDIEAVVAKMKKSGGEPFGEIQRYEDSYKLCYVRGPEGIILEVAEQLT